MGSWYSQTWSDQGYDLNFTVRTTNDCDENGTVDAEELVKGRAVDCNADGIIDSCQGERPQDLSLVGQQQEPIGNGIERQFLFPGIVPSDGNVTLTVHAYGDLSASHEFLLLSIGGGTPLPIFTGVQADCTWLSQQFTFTESQFDQFIADGNLDIRIGASGTVDPLFCGNSYVWLQLDYRERYVDCNGNRVPDVVDICGGVALDCNGNLIPDACDLADGRSLDLDANGQPDECQYDCNGDSRPDGWQIATGEYPDCNGNGVLDVCDLSAQSSADCNSNSVPDECDVASGSVADCDGDIVPDHCAISSGIVPDCDGNGVPDGCDVASGAVPDCNGNGLPDACDVSPDYVQFQTGTQSPFYNGYPIVQTLKGVGALDSDPRIELQYLTYTYGYYGRVITVWLDEHQVVYHYDYYWGGCWGGTRSWGISRDIWNEAASDGVIELRIENIDGNNCSSSFCRGFIRYPNEFDCNFSGIPDSCEIVANPSLDCDGNGLIDACDISGGAEDKNANGHLDACELARGDLDLDGVVGGGDLAVLLSLWGVTGSPVGDLNNDGQINAMDATILLGNWGTTP